MDLVLAWPRALMVVVAMLAAGLLGLAFSGSGGAHPAATPIGHAALAHAPLRPITNGTSENWAGYDAHPGKFTQVSASWTEPTVTCGASETSYSSFWVGLDGGDAKSATVEQTGTDADCSSGTPTYYAWYEMYPAYPVNLQHAVQAGDALSASVTTDGTGSFTLTIADTTQGWTSKTQQSSSQASLLSAEVIAEAPSSSSGVLPLANFGTVDFSASMANQAALGSSSPEELVMQTGSTVKAQPSTLSGGESFSVSWRHS